jgi:glucose/mannose-6-phosphate isomerase
MTYDELLKGLSWKPEPTAMPRGGYARVVVGGMGGSALPANAGRFLEASLPFAAHRDYGLPEDASADALYVAMSYSGNTEETLSFAEEALRRGFNLAAVDDGGALGALARDKNFPHVLVPGGMQPRNALFYQLRALLALTGRTELSQELESASFDAGEAQAAADALAEMLSGGLPVFYSSRGNAFLAHAAKINMNETAKMPAYANVFPEMNHNEMQSFDTMAPDASASAARLVLLHDEADDARIRRRMDVMRSLMHERGRRIVDVPITGASRAEKLARGWFVSHRAALALAEERGVDPEAVPFIEDFKKRL